MFPFYAYFTIFLIPAICWVFMGTGALATGIVLAATFLLYPVLDWIVSQLLSRRLVPLKASSELSLYRIPLYLSVPFQFAITATALILGSKNLPEAALCGTLAGISGGLLGVTSGHALIHRRAKWERNYGKALLFIAHYPHFHIEHFIHHAHVATPEDVDSARHGESLYAFLYRSVTQGWMGCWRKEAKRLSLRGKKIISLQNAMVVATLIQALILLGIFAVLNANAVIAYLFTGAGSIILLKLTNYIEHYGLSRKMIDGRYEPVGAQHSWDSKTPLTNLTLFNLGYHSEHHRHPKTAYYQLPDAMPTHAHPLPMGYFPMMLLALIPPLWYRTMEPRL